jgi:hypothetical protein
MNAFVAAAGNGLAEHLREDLAELFEAHNHGGRFATEIPATYLKVTVTKQ